MSEHAKATITSTESPSHATPGVHTVTADNGLVIRLRKPGPLAQFDLVEALGDTAANETYTSMCMPLTYIETVDGEMVPISTKREIRALITQLGDDGLRAVAVGVMEHFGKRSESAAKADEAKLKN